MGGMPGMAQVIKQLQETATVTAAIQSRHAAMLKDHAEWLQAHDKAIIEARARSKKIDEQIEKQAARGKETDERIEKLGERIEKLVIAIGRLVASKSS